MPFCRKAAAGEPVNALRGHWLGEEVLIEHAIEQANGNYTEAAKLLAVHAKHLFRLISDSKLEGEASAMTRKSFMTVNKWQFSPTDRQACRFPISNPLTP